MLIIIVVVVVVVVVVDDDDNLFGDGVYVFVIIFIFL